MIPQWFEREEEVERRRRGVEMVMDRREVVRLFLGSVAGAGLCSTPQCWWWAHVGKSLAVSSAVPQPNQGRPRVGSTYLLSLFGIKCWKHQYLGRYNF